jgi:ABC-type amino acid transport substrate-binding protein
MTGSFTSAPTSAGSNRQVGLTRWRIILPSIAVGGLVIAAIALQPRVEPDRSLERIQQAGVLTVGLDPSYPPFEVVNGQGELAGLDVELVDEISRQLGVRVALVAVDFGGIFDALAVGKFDAVIGGITPSPDQSTTIGFTRPYYDDGLVVLTRAGDSGQVLGYESGSDAELDLDLLRPNLSGFELRAFDDQDRMRSALEQHSLKGVILDAVTASEWASTAPGLTVQSRRLTSTPYSVATRAGDQALLRAIDQSLVQLEASGSIAALARKWLPE